VTAQDISSIVEHALRRHGAFDKYTENSRVAIALSGGVDSMVLLDIVVKLIGRHSAMPSNSPIGAEFEGITPINFQAVHVNHGISPNAQAWANFCREECAKRNIPITIETVVVDRNSGTGLEAAARTARYAALQKCDAQFMLTAQHADDQAETVLHQMLRGTGLAGFAGMGEARVLNVGQTLLRPLLHVKRSDIEAYAATQQLNWITDESNADTTYTRNFIRHELTPKIESRFPHYAESLARIARHAHEANELNEALAKIDLQWDGKEAYADKLDTLPITRQVNALYHWLRWQKVDPPSHAQLETWASQLFRASPEGKPHLAGGHGVVIRRRKNLLTIG
jgi:tRNA(Ile)-lysidine synthase